MKPKWNRLSGLSCGSVFLCALLLTASFQVTASDRYDPFRDKSRTPSMIPVLDGSYVHNIGELQMNVTNWGILGSLPNSNYPMRDVPSAQYPAGSGIEYLYAAGIWVGARKNGIPCVSTGYPEDEFRPRMDATSTIYETFEGDLRGGHLPAAPDDDVDGVYDEDPLNGLDDDNDGKIDEDFAAFGNQMFCCEYADNFPQSTLIWPEHEQIEIKVRQETFQWGENVYNDFIAIKYTITNVGIEYLSDIYLGIYADMDAGSRNRGTYHMDDKVGFWNGTWCAAKGNAEYPVDLNLAYVYDDDGDDGTATGYFGIAVLGHSPQVSFGNAALFPSFALQSFKVFQGLQPFMNGGDPTNDFERYEIMSEPARDENTDKPGDYRILLSVGPFYSLQFMRSLELSLAFVAGDDFNDLRDNAATAQNIYNGIRYDMDGNPETGINGRESPLVGPLEDWDPDPCDGVKEELDIIKGDTIWSNLDCSQERTDFNNRDCYKEYGASFQDYQTGTGGREHRLRWITSGVSPPPNIRVEPGDGYVAVFWDNLSEVTADIVTGVVDFEGYQVWRADDWHRPLGSSKENGPESSLWSLLENRDLVNGVLPNVDFKRPLESGGWEYDPLEYLVDREMVINAFEQSLIYAPLDNVPCPPGLTQNECDTLETLARLNLGYEGGKKYYKFVDHSVKNGLPYFYSVVAYDHSFDKNGIPLAQGRMNSPSASFAYIEARSSSREADEYEETEVYAVPNPVTREAMSGWELGPTNSDPSGLKVEIRNLPACKSVLRIFTIAGDLVQTLPHDGSNGNGTVVWNLVSRNGQEVTSGVYLFAVEPEDNNFDRTIGKFVVIR
ncbi:MAG: hypothetical protein KOO63_14715 [Bacteroidales bacterium]|nr:hypothetical protein [Candidatus Latescibacterota bacterium]